MSTCSRYPFNEEIGDVNPEFFSCSINRINYVLLVLWLIKIVEKNAAGVLSFNTKITLMVLSILISPVLYQVAIAVFYFFFCGLYPWAMALVVTYKLYALSRTSQNDVGSNYLLDEGSTNSNFTVNNILQSSIERKLTEQEDSPANLISTSSVPVQVGPSSQSIYTSTLPLSQNHAQLVTSNFLTDRSAVSEQPGNFPIPVNNTFENPISADQMSSSLFSGFPSNYLTNNENQQGISRELMCFHDRSNLTLNTRQKNFVDVQTITQKNMFENPQRSRSAEHFTSFNVSPSLALNQSGFFSRYDTEPQAATVEMPHPSLLSSHLSNGHSTAVDQPEMSSNFLQDASENMNLDQGIGDTTTVTVKRTTTRKRVTADQQEDTLLSRFIATRRGASAVNQPENSSGSTFSEGDDTETSESENISETVTTQRRTPAKKKRRKKTTINYHSKRKPRRN